ncbi:alpha-E domain-containing protein [Rhodobacteraceae bacterium]|nr:alpha-E domain-containing protein [Paracoccaceae bacterium]
MLSRTAENLVWVARYIERAETMARLLEVGARITMIPTARGDGYRSEWESLLQASGTAAGFAEKYGDPVERNIESYLFFDRDNPSSVVSCFEHARENARIVRTAISSQVWDALNVAYQELRQLERRSRSEVEMTELTEWVTRHVTMVRGAIDTTLLRNDGYHFLNLGFALERADNTARLIDVKYYVLLPSLDMVGSELDTYQWQTLLRALQSYRAFHFAYGGEIGARKIAHFLILNGQSPRSLLTTAEKATYHLDCLGRDYNKSGLPQMRARALMNELERSSVEEIFNEGLHEFLTRFIREVGGLSKAVYDTYLSGVAR